jgi:hypothetical protein
MKDERSIRVGEPESTRLTANIRGVNTVECRRFRHTGHPDRDFDMVTIGSHDGCVKIFLPSGGLTDFNIAVDRADFEATTVRKK